MSSSSSLCDVPLLPPSVAMASLSTLCSIALSSVGMSGVCVDNVIHGGREHPYPLCRALVCDTLRRCGVTVSKCAKLVHVDHSTVTSYASMLSSIRSFPTRRDSEILSSYDKSIASWVSTFSSTSSGECVGDMSQGLLCPVGSVLSVPLTEDRLSSAMRRLNQVTSVQRYSFRRGVDYVLSLLAPIS